MLKLEANISADIQDFLLLTFTRHVGKFIKDFLAKIQYYVYIFLVGQEIKQDFFPQESKVSWP